MTGLRSIAIKFIAFGIVSGLMLLLLANTMTNGVSGDTRSAGVLCAWASTPTTLARIRVPSMKRNVAPRPASA